MSLVVHIKLIGLTHILGKNDKNQQLTLLIPKRLLQHGENDRVVQDKVAEVAGPCRTESGIANQGVFI